MKKRLYCEIPDGDKTISIKVFFEGKFLKKHITKVCYISMIDVFELWHKDYLFLVTRNNGRSMKDLADMTFYLNFDSYLSEADLFRNKDCNKNLFNKIYHINSLLNLIDCYSAAGYVNHAMLNSNLLNLCAESLKGTIKGIGK